MHQTDDPRWGRALFRFAAVSQVESFILGGLTPAAAVLKVASASIPDASGRLRRVTRASLYRWRCDYKAHGLDGLFDDARGGKTRALGEDMLSFLVTEKAEDPEASIPEVIKRARERTILSQSALVDRTTVYRAARRLNLPMFRRRKAETTAMRPFAYAHRMQMVLSDGNHFRAGGARLKRVALFFLDDATRYVLDVFVGTSESAEFFLRSLFGTLNTFGYMGALYLDRGPGFIADQTARVMANLKIPLIHGAARYPEGHGKIERFNDTVFLQCLSSLAKPEIDPAPKALELRIRHFLRQRYNLTFHEGIDGVPGKRFDDDEKPLSFPDSEELLRRAFILSESRKVRRDNVIPWNDIVYEVPLGYAGRRVTIYQDIVTGDLSVMHDGRAVKLHPPDLQANARDKRHGRPKTQAFTRPITTAAELHFNREHAPIVGPDGGFLEPKQIEE